MISTCKQCGEHFQHRSDGRGLYCSLECWWEFKKIHDQCNSPEYVSWRHMKQRCTNPRRKEYPHYGGRGISVCERWQTFANFIADMGLRPGPKYTLDRVNNEGNYEPDNCRWATRTEQSRNRRPWSEWNKSKVTA